jgi:hemerythrin-like domain-containing protein
MQPAQGIRFIHTAIRREAHAIEEQAMAAEAPEQLGALRERVSWFAEINKLHTDGEELALYPELEQRARYVGAAYLHDHRDEHALFTDLVARIGEAETASAATRAGLLAKVRRQSIAMVEHVVPHVHKEDTLITPLICELFSPSEQGAHIGRMMGSFPPDKMAKVMPWMVTLIDAPDRITYVQMIRHALPADRFAGACAWLRTGCPTDVWRGIAAAVPDLPL